MRSNVCHISQVSYFSIIYILYFLWVWEFFKNKGLFHLYWHFCILTVANKSSRLINNKRSQHHSVVNMQSREIPCAPPGVGEWSGIFLIKHLCGWHLASINLILFFYFIKIAYVINASRSVWAVARCSVLCSVGLHVRGEGGTCGTACSRTHARTHGQIVT